MQAAEATLKSESFTLHTEAPHDHNKIVGQQITLDNGVTMSLGFRQVAAEDSATLLEITIELLEELGDIYCKAHEESEKKDNLQNAVEKNECADVRQSITDEMLQRQNESLH